MKIRQVQRERFPNGGWPIGQIAVTPKELVECLGVRLEKGADGLGTMDLIAFALPDGTQSWLFRHHYSSYDGMMVVADAGRLPSEVRPLVVEALDISDEQMMWWASDEERAAPPGFY